MWKTMSGAHFPNTSKQHEVCLVPPRHGFVTGDAARVSLAWEGQERSLDAPQQVRGKAPIMTGKMRAHVYTAVEDVAIQKTMEMESYRLPACERPACRSRLTRYRSSASGRAWFVSALPASGSRRSPAWFEVVIMIAFCRYNCAHCVSAKLPPWCARDSLPSQRLDGFIAASTPLESAEDEDLNVLFAPFKRRSL